MAGRPMERSANGIPMRSWGILSYQHWLRGCSPAVVVVVVIALVWRECWHPTRAYKGRVSHTEPVKTLEDIAGFELHGPAVSVFFLG